MRYSLFFKTTISSVLFSITSRGDIFLILLSFIHFFSCVKGFFYKEGRGGGVNRIYCTIKAKHNTYDLASIKNLYFFTVGLTESVANRRLMFI